MPILFLPLLFFSLTLPALGFDTLTLDNFPSIKIFLFRVGVLSLAFSFLSYSLWKEKPLKITLTPLLFFTLFLFLFFSALSYLHASNSSEWWGRFSFLLGCLFLFFAPQLFLRERGVLLPFLLSLLLPSILISAYGLLQFAGYEPLFDTPRLLMTSTLGHINFVGQYLLTITPLALALCFLKSGVFLRSFCFLILFVNLSCLVATYTRGAWLGFLVALGAMFLLSRLRRTSSASFFTFSGKKVIPSLLILLLFSLPAMWFIASQPQVLRSFFHTSLTDVEKDSTEITGRESWRMISNNITRIKTWESTLKMIKDAPLLGVGLGNYAIVYPPYRQWEEKEMETRIRWYAHNDYLQIAAEAGVPALLCFLLFLSALFGKVISFIKSIPTEKAEERMMIIGLSGSVIATLTHAFFSFNLYQPFSAPFFWFACGSLLLLTEPDAFKREERLSRKKKLSFPFKFFLFALLSIACILLLRESIKRYHAEIVYSQTERIMPEHGTAPLIQGFTQASRINPDEAKYWYALGRAYAIDNNPKKAAPAYNKALKLTPNVPAVRFQYAQSLEALGETKQAIKELKKILVIDNEYSDAHNELGRIYYAVRENDEAIKEYRAAEASLLRKKEGIEKQLIFDEEYKPASMNLALSNLYYNLGNAFIAKGDLPNAEKLFYDGSKKAENNPLPFIGLGDVAQLRKEYMQAEAFYQQAMRLAPDMAFPRQRLNALHNMQKNSE